MDYYLQHIAVLYCSHINSELYDRQRTHRSIPIDTKRILAANFVHSAHLLFVVCNRRSRHRYHLQSNHLDWCVGKVEIV